MSSNPNPSKLRNILRGLFESPYDFAVKTVRVNGPWSYEGVAEVKLTSLARTLQRVLGIVSYLAAQLISLNFVVALVTGREGGFYNFWRKYVFGAVALPFNLVMLALETFIVGWMDLLRHKAFDKKAEASSNAQATVTEPEQKPANNPGQEPENNPGQEPANNPGQEPENNPGQEPENNPEQEQKPENNPDQNLAGTDLEKLKIQLRDLIAKRDEELADAANEEAKQTKDRDFYMNLIPQAENLITEAKRELGGEGNEEGRTQFIADVQEYLVEAYNKVAEHHRGQKIAEDEQKDLGETPESQAELKAEKAAQAATEKYLAYDTAKEGNEIDAKLGLGVFMVEAIEAEQRIEDKRKAEQLALNLSKIQAVTAWVSEQTQKFGEDGSKANTVGELLDGATQAQTHLSTLDSLPADLDGLAQAKTALLTKVTAYAWRMQEKDEAKKVDFTTVKAATEKYDAAQGNAKLFRAYTDVAFEYLEEVANQLKPADKPEPVDPVSPTTPTEPEVKSPESLAQLTGGADEGSSTSPANVAGSPTDETGTGTDLVETVLSQPGSPTTTLPGQQNHKKAAEDVPTVVAANDPADTKTADAGGATANGLTNSAS